MHMGRGLCVCIAGEWPGVRLQHVYKYENFIIVVPYDNDLYPAPAARPKAVK